MPVKNHSLAVKQSWNGECIHQIRDDSPCDYRKTMVASDQDKGDRRKLVPMLGCEQLERELDRLDGELRHVADERRRNEIVAAIRHVATQLYGSRAPTTNAGASSDRLER